MPRRSYKNIIISSFKRVGSKFRHGLALGAALSRLSKIGIEIIPYYLVQEGIDDSAFPKIKDDATKYSVSFFGLQEMKIIGETTRGYEEGTLLTRLQEGKKCIGIKRNSHIAAFMWIDLKECNHKPDIFPLKKNEAYLYDMHTLDAFRGKNIAPYLRYQSYGSLKNIGRDTFYSVSSLLNKSSIKFKKKLNAKLLKLVLSVGLFNKFHKNFTIKAY